MENYIGCKIIKARKANYGEYRKIKYGNVDGYISTINNCTDGYLVIYPPIGESEEKPHISWSPKEIFEKAYRKIENAEVSLIFGDGDGDVK